MKGMGAGVGDLGIHLNNIRPVTLLATHAGGTSHGLLKSSRCTHDFCYQMGTVTLVVVNI